MLSILVCHSYFMRFDPKQRERAKPYPPLATLQVAAALRGAGHEVTVFDAMLAEGVEQFEALLRERRPQLVLLYEDNYNFLTKMCLARMREAACRMIRTARHERARVIAAGSDASDAPYPYLQAGADAVLLGEGLGTLFALVLRLDTHPDVSQQELTADLPGVASTRSGAGRPVNTATLPSPQLSELPAWDLIDIERYRQTWQAAHGYFSLNMAASRGCPFRCTWCAKPIWGNQYLQRSASAVAAEMTHLKRLFRPEHIWFADDIFGFRVDWVMDFAAAVGSSDGSIPFTIQTRADLISERMAHALALAGCKEAWLGAESGSQKILDAMNKGTTVQQIYTARARLKAAGIRVGFFIQLGYLGEELPDIIATRELISGAQPDDIGVSVSYPLPGTRFYELVRAQLNGKTHWQDSDDLAMMFQGTYTSEFYRAIRDLIHKQVALQVVADHAPSSPEQKALERRWHKLLSREGLYRSPARETSGAVLACATRGRRSAQASRHRADD
jgi:anaerobic magnesium-protoporphyrin IX monomethyl ester cyclase